MTGATEQAVRVLSWRRMRAHFKEHPLARVGPGLITGVADDDRAVSPPTLKRARSSGSTCCGPCLQASR